MKCKKLILRIEYYSVWIIANFLICLLPIWITYLITSDVSKIMASYIAFIFTRVIGSLYVFHYKGDEVSFDKLINWSTILYILISLSCLPLYMTVTEVTSYLNLNYSPFIILSSIVTIGICLLLNFKVIENRVLDKFNSIQLKVNIGKTEEKFMKMKSEIEKS
jgi:hypothetical protein